MPFSSKDGIVLGMCFCAPPRWFLFWTIPYSWLLLFVYIPLWKSRFLLCVAWLTSAVCSCGCILYSCDCSLPSEYKFSDIWVKLAFAWDFNPPHLLALSSQVPLPLQWWQLLMFGMLWKFKKGNPFLGLGFFFYLLAVSVSVGALSHCYRMTSF